MGWNRVMPEVMRSFFADFRAWPNLLYSLSSQSFEPEYLIGFTYLIPGVSR
jgi:hypothetical protein